VGLGPKKDRANRRIPGLETAKFVFDDYHAASRPKSRGERWLTNGMISAVVVLVSHTWPEPVPDSGEVVWLIISA